MPVRQKERHRTERIGWLRAAVLGANDGIVSTASLVLGVAAAHGTRSNVLVAGVAGLVAGAMAMAAGEYVSVHSQADTEQAELARERAELKADDKGEHEELTAIYVGRGLDPLLAKQVADQLMAHDAIGAHARDELGISADSRRAPDSSRARVGCELRGRSRHASPGHHLGPAVGSEHSCPRNIAALPGAFGCIGGGRGRRACDGGRNARRLLGGAGHGDHRGRRGLVWNGRMSWTEPGQ